MYYDAQGIVIAGMQSSSGKTAVTCLVLAALRARGMPVQAFKTGPDYLDPQYHAHFSGAASRNLDAWLMGREGVQREVAAALGGRIGVLEGVMGLFDGGVPDSDEGSAMELARWLGWPIILVVPAAKAGRSLAAAVRGFVAEAGPGRIRGLVLNGVSGESHGAYLRQALEPLGVPVVGVLPELPALRWPERHLGLSAASEVGLASWEEAARLAEEYLDLDSVVSWVAGGKAGRHGGNSKAVLRSEPDWHIALQDAGAHARIAIARDEAFHFYYEGNLEWLARAGVELVEFSPLRDEGIPVDVDGLIFGGGFPEVFAERLAANQSMRGSIRRAVAGGLPCYAECGGLMLLADELVTIEGRRFPMAGVIPGAVEMTDRLVHFGYCSCASGERLFRGHEFHHSRWTGEEEHANLWQVARRRGGKARREGFRLPNLHASYVHLYWPAAGPIFADLFGLELGAERIQGQEAAAV